jgi:pilus assembly protein CpaC
LFKSTSFRKGETELVIVVTPYLVKPVSENDIHLPTDGFRAADEAQGLIGYRENDGVSGASRPTATATGDGTPPAVSRIEPQAVLPAQAASTDARDRRKARKDRRAEAAAPGFSIK